MKKMFVFIIIVFLVVCGILIYIQKYEKSFVANKITHSVNKNVNKSNSMNVEATTTIATGLNVPWAIVFLPDGRLMFTQRSGNIKIIDKDGNLSPTNVVSINVYKSRDSEGGLLGMALSPNFGNNHYVYLYYTYSGDRSSTLNRVIRMKFEDDKLSDEKIIVDKIPGALYHNGGRIKFGPDGYLYITTGDSQKPSLSQDKNSLAGKILRIQEDGSPAPGNPFNNLVYSYGHRNPQGIAWDESNNLYETEHGRSNPTGFDELNKIESGKNYGWPNIQGDEKASYMISPLINSGSNDTWAPASAAYLNGSIWFGGLKGQAIYEFNTSTKQLTEHLKNQFGRIREVVVGPDNMLYISTSNNDSRGNPSSSDDRIIKINPSKFSVSP